MNRLIIVGNGFDLAHGLPTSYGHFIDDYWKNACDTKGGNQINYNDNLVTINCTFGYLSNIAELGEMKKIINYRELKEFIARNSSRYGRDGIFEIKFTNVFFERICDRSIENWVDIENAYYEILKARAKGDFRKYNYPWDITQLNNEFDQVKSLLEKYLKEKVVDTYDLRNVDVSNSLSNIFSPEIFNNDTRRGRWYQDFSKEDKKYINGLMNNLDTLDVQLHFLSFNYTPTLNKYASQLSQPNIKTHVNYIHGSIVNDDKINFGFGDEMDDDYKLIENINDNEYLMNFKSFQYLHYPNYKELLDFIDSEKFEVFIMGHSCGLSDRTLLNTVFEHENCRLIRVFYHENDKGDNFTELTQNISRHFTNKPLMRSKLVHKSSSKAMPQIELTKKEVTA